jgi:hypothetical protein
VRYADDDLREWLWSKREDCSAARIVSKPCTAGADECTELIEYVIDDEPGEICDRCLERGEQEGI